MKLKKIINFNNILILAYFLLTLFVTLKHEIWRDEGQAWLIARDSTSFSSFLKTLGYEGTPGLYHVLLMLFAKTGLPVISMSLLNVAIMTSAVAIFVYGFPFNKFIKAASIFGYYMAYEYGTIARSYSLLILFVFAIAAIYKKRHEYKYLYPILVLLLSNTCLHGTIIAIAFLAAYIYELIFVLKKINTSSIVSLAIMFFGIALSVFQMIPPPDLGSSEKWALGMSPLRVCAHALFPLVKNEIQFWNTSAIPMTFYIWVLGSLALVLPAFMIRKPRNILLCYTAWTGLLIVSCFRHIGGLRHTGILFIVLLAVLWIDYSEELGKPIKVTKASKFPKASNASKIPMASKGSTISLVKTYITRFVLPCILIIGIISSAIAVYYENGYYFSSAKRAAEFIKSQGYANNLLIVYPANCGASIMPYMGNKSKFYALEYGRDISYMIWDKTYEEYYEKYYYHPEALPLVDSKLLSAMDSNGVKSAIMVTNIPIDTTGLKNKYDILARFNTTIVNDEQFFVYKISKANT